MFKRLVISAATFAVAFVIVAMPASAQRSRTKRSQQASQSMAVSPYVGYITFGELANGPLNTSLKSKAAPIYGVQLNPSDAQAKDFPLLQSTVLLIGVVFLVVTLVADILYSVLNPRVRLGSAE